MGKYLIAIAIIYIIVGLLNYKQVANRIFLLFNGTMALDYRGVIFCVLAWPWSYLHYKGMEDDFES